MISHFLDWLRFIRRQNWRGVFSCVARKNVFLYAASQSCKVCRGFSASFEATAWIWCKHKDVSPSLRVFWGTFGLQSAEKGPNSRHNPGMDSSTVSPVKDLLCTWLLSIVLVFTYYFNIFPLLCTKAINSFGLLFSFGTDVMVHIPLVVKTEWVVGYVFIWYCRRKSLDWLWFDFCLIWSYRLARSFTSGVSQMTGNLACSSH